MRTLWTASPVERVFGRGEGEVSSSGKDTGTSDVPDDEDLAKIPEHEPSSAPHVGRVNAWRELGFSSAKEMREHHGSDFWKYNFKRTRNGRASLTEQEFTKMIEGDDDDLSSISGSEGDSDSDSDSADDEGQTGVTNNSYKAVHGAGEGAQVVCQGSDGTRFALWRCLAGPDSLFRGSQKVDPVSALNAFNALKNNPTKPWVVVLARGGHFAAAAFDPSKFYRSMGKETEKKSRDLSEHELLTLVPISSSIEHKTFHRYVVRAKAGGRQSGKDGGGKTIKSAGSSIRRANELALEKEVTETMTDKTWSQIFDSASLIFVSASKTDTRTLFVGANSQKAPLDKSDTRIRKVPFATKRPTFNETRRVVGKLAEVNYEVQVVGDFVESNHVEKSQQEQTPPDSSLSAAQLGRIEEARKRAENTAKSLSDVSFADLDDSGVDDSGDADHQPEIKSLSKKEKEKLKKQRAKDRLKEAKKHESEGSNVPEQVKTPRKEIEPPVKPKKSKGGKAAALLAKKKESQAGKRNEAVRTFLVFFHFLPIISFF